MIEQNIGFIGAGEMARALARGLLMQNLIRPDRLLVSDPNSSAVQRFAESVHGCRVLESNRALADAANTVICAVKPQHLVSAMEDIRGRVADKLFVSVVAGVTMERIAALIQSKRLVRVMPNTACMVCAGASAYTRSEHATTEDVALVDEILSSLGIAVEVAEAQLDIVTGLSGSGPAYVFTFVQALADGAVLMGLPRTTAMALAVQTVLGAAKMLRESGDHPALLSDRVASAGGTTIHGLAALEERGFARP